MSAVWLAAIPLLYWALGGALTSVLTYLYVPRLGPRPSGEGLPLGAPTVSVILSARDEGRHIEATLRSLLAQDYPHLEIIAVNDRSGDDTGEVMSSIEDRRLRVLTIRDLPSGWLGKTHGLWAGYRASKGDLLLFTDADVVFHPGAVRACVGHLLKGPYDNLTLFPGLVLKSYFEAMFVSYFTIIFNLRYQPWAARFRRLPYYVGIGAFSLVRRQVYEKAGTHQAVALDVADDMMLGRALKRAGARQIACFGTDLIRVRWVEGARGVFEALQKNAFRGVNYSGRFLVLSSAMILIVDWAPFLGLLCPDPLVRSLGLAAAGLIALVYVLGGLHTRWAPWCFPAHPVAGLLFVVILWRSAIRAWREGGVRWRGTLYPLEELRAQLRR